MYQIQKFVLLLSYLTSYLLAIQTGFHMNNNQNNNKIKIGVYYGSDAQYDNQNELKRLTIDYTIRKLNQFYSSLGVQFESKIISLSSHNSFKALKYGLTFIENVYSKLS